jgi:prophage DNA circulation protein
MLGALAGMARPRTGYFREAPFRVDSYEHESGRRHEVHEYPLRDEALPEDLGRKTRRITFSAYVIGFDWEAQRDRLLDACEQEGSGLLLHPWLGEFQCLCANVRVSESRGGGSYICQFELDFVEDGGFKYPEGRQNPERGVYAATDTAFPASAAGFASNFQVAGFAGFVADDASAAVSGLVADVTTYLARSVADPAALAALETVIPRAPAAFVREPPQTVGDELVAFIRGFGSTVIEDPDAALAAMQVFAVWSPDLPPVYGRTPTRRQQLANRTAITNVVRQAAAIAAAERLPEIELDPPSVAIRTRDAFTTGFAGVLEAASVANDRTANALKEVNAATTTLLTAAIGPVAAAGPATSLVSQPLNAAAHAIYRDARRAERLRAANPTPHPSFMPLVLEVPLL